MWPKWFPTYINLDVFVLRRILNVVALTVIHKIVFTSSNSWANVKSCLSFDKKIQIDHSFQFSCLTCKSSICSWLFSSSIESCRSVCVRYMQQVITKTFAENPLLSLPIPFIPPLVPTSYAFTPQLGAAGSKFAWTKRTVCRRSMAAGAFRWFRFGWVRLSLSHRKPGVFVCRLPSVGVLLPRHQSDPNFQTHTYYTVILDKLILL